MAGIRDLIDQLVNMMLLVLLPQLKASPQSKSTVQSTVQSPAFTAVTHQYYVTALKEKVGVTVRRRVMRIL